jgi:3-oxoacyl-[acyl-carrier protein] reductase
MQSSLHGRLALIIGGSGAIGAATARLFAGAGARVVVTHTARSAASAVALVESLPGADNLKFPADVADTASLLALRDAVRGRCGQTLHVLVNAAGFTKPVPHADLDALDDELIDRMFAVNWRGQFAAIRTFAPMLKASGVVDTHFVPGRGAEFNTKTAATTPLRRVASPEDVAEAVLACAISLRFSTGTTLVVDGGRSL